MVKALVSFQWGVGVDGIRLQNGGADVDNNLTLAELFITNTTVLQAIKAPVHAHDGTGTHFARRGTPFVFAVATAMTTAQLHG